MKKSGPVWLERRLTQCAYYYCLCLTPDEMRRELKSSGCEQENWPRYFVSENGHATTHHYLNDEGKAVALVCMDFELSKKYSSIQVASLLVHEAVHIWQLHSVRIGSFNDHGDEEEAYAIQSISQALMEEYSRRLEVK